MEGFRKILNGRGFKWMIGSMVVVRVFALVPQLIVSITEERTEGISVSMMTIFLVAYVAMILEAIRVKSWAIGISTIIALLLTLAILIIVLIKRGW